MSPVVGATLTLLLFGLATILADALPPRVRILPPTVLGIVLLLLFMELTRYDHGHGDFLLWVGWGGAPAVIVAGLVTWAVRAFRRLPPLGRHLRRATAVAAFVATGVFAGWRLAPEDLRQSEVRGAALAARFLETPPPDGSWTEERSSLGWLAPPRYWYGHDEHGRAILAFHLGAAGWRVLTVGERTWRTVADDPAVAVRRSEPPR